MQMRRLLQDGDPRISYACSLFDLVIMLCFYLVDIILGNKFIAFFKIVFGVIPFWLSH